MEMRYFTYEGVAIHGMYPQSFRIWISEVLPYSLFPETETDNGVVFSTCLGRQTSRIAGQVAGDTQCVGGLSTT